jgi:hypothetical protein
MRVASLASYICGVCLLLALLASAITNTGASTIWARCCRPRPAAWHSWRPGRRSASGGCRRRTAPTSPSRSGLASTRSLSP